jgi:hypothetical protein
MGTLLRRTVAPSEKLGREQVVWSLAPVPNQTGIVCLVQTIRTIKQSIRDATRVCAVAAGRWQRWNAIGVEPQKRSLLSIAGHLARKSAGLVLAMPDPLVGLAQSGLAMREYPLPGHCGAWLNLARRQRRKIGCAFGSRESRPQDQRLNVVYIDGAKQPAGTARQPRRRRRVCLTFLTETEGSVFVSLNSGSGNPNNLK